MSIRTADHDLSRSTKVEHTVPHQRPKPTSANRPAQRRRPTFRRDIEGLRAIAVVTVVLYHFHLLGSNGGYVGVDIFFVISGFLITGQLTGRMGRFDEPLRHTIATFYAGRFRRLFPAAAVTIGVTLLLTRLFAPALQQTSIYTDAIFASIYSINYRLAVTGTEYLHQGDAVSPLQHFWSLAVEEQFYLFWPAILACVFLAFRNRWTRALPCLLALGTIWSLYECYVVTARSQPWAYFSLSTRAWELGAGGLICVAGTAGARIPRLLGEALTVGGLALIGYSVFTFTDATVFPGLAALVPVAGAAMVILAGARPELVISRVLSVRPMQFIGRISYSWYLWHWPLLVLAPYVLGHPLTLGERVAVLGLSLLTATQSFWIVEEPMRILPLVTWRWLLVGLAGATTMSLIGLGLIATQPAVTGSGKATAAQSLTSGTGGSAAARISGILSASIGTKVVPANLQPSLTAAPDDVASTHYNGCHQDYTYATPPSCEYGDLQSKNVAVLFGDSHMEQWFPGFDAAGEKAHWKIINWTKSGCGFTDVETFNSTLNRMYTDCTKWRSLIVSRIIALHPSVVVVSGAEDIANGQVSDAAWVADSVKTARTLIAAGIKVVFIEDIGRATSVIPVCLSENLDSAARCTFSAAGSIIRPQRHREIATGMKAAGAQVVDPQPWLCAEGTCPVIVGNLLVYRDDNHLTATFSRWLAPVLAPILVR